ncbi:MAG: hypothetical protein NC416_15215 [Eubacterium sp.]|nr:hypothetical protein [Eubacterium sp.]
MVELKFIMANALFIAYFVPECLEFPGFEKGNAGNNVKMRGKINKDELH